MEEDKEKNKKRTWLGEEKNEESLTEEQNEEGKQNKKMRKVEGNTEERKKEDWGTEKEKVKQNYDEDGSTTKMKEGEWERKQEERGKVNKDKKEKDVEVNKTKLSTDTKDKTDKVEERTERLKEEMKEEKEEAERDDKLHTQMDEHTWHEAETNAGTHQIINTQQIEHNLICNQAATIDERIQTPDNQTQTITYSHTTTPPPLSKRQMKKQLKRARWLETKGERRKLKRQREKEKARERRLLQSQLTLDITSKMQPLEKFTQPSLAPVNSVLAPPSPIQTLESSSKANISPVCSDSIQEQDHAQELNTLFNVASFAPTILHGKPTITSTHTFEQPSTQVALSAPSVAPVSRRALKKHSVKMSVSLCKLRVAIDLSLEGMMDDRRLGQCLRQVARCYSANRRVPAPLQLFVTSFCGRPKALMSLQAGYENWDINFRTESYLDAFEQSDIVYLTSESSNTLEKLEHSKVYIIGGLVDHNKLKGHCLKLATDFNLSTARLPIDKYLDMSTRKVLTIDQVFRILLGVAGGNGWRDVLLSVLPPRKGAKGKEEEEEEDKTEEIKENNDTDRTEEIKENNDTKN